MTITQDKWWLREIVPPTLDTVVDNLCAHYKVPRTYGGTKGDESHLTGRHRSMEWVRNSPYCTNRSYGTINERDKRGNPRHIRAFDIKIPRSELIKACTRLNREVRAGRLPKVAEWYGTFDGKNVVGWYEGHPAGADPSHLTHLHCGLWTENADDDHTDIFNTITGAKRMNLTDEDCKTIKRLVREVVYTEALPATHNVDPGATTGVGATWHTARWARKIAEEDMPKVLDALDAHGLDYDKLGAAIVREFIRQAMNLEPLTPTPAVEP